MIERIKDLPHVVASGKEARILKGPCEKPFYCPEQSSEAEHG